MHGCLIDLSGIDKPSFSDRIKKFLLQNLPEPFLTDSKRETLETILKSLWNLTTIPHHPSPPGYFNRADAEMVVLITTSLLAYVGKLLKQKEKV